jgi:hypothetical protein
LQSIELGTDVRVYRLRPFRLEDLHGVAHAPLDPVEAVPAEIVVLADVAVGPKKSIRAAAGSCSDPLVLVM